MSKKLAVALCVSGAAAALLLAGCSSGPSETAPSQTQKVVIVYPNLSPSQWPLFAAKDAGIYAKYGLDTELQFAVHPGSVAMLASGQGHMVNSSLDQMMQAASKDGSMILIGSSLNRGTFALMANKSITAIEQLKGKKIAISQIGDAPYGYLVAILAKAGLGDRDVEWVPVGQGVAGRAAALESGRADATLLTAPAYFRLEQAGYSTLVNMAEREDIFASTAYLVSKNATPELRESLVKAHAVAIKLIYENRDAAIKAYLAFDQAAKPEDMGRIHDLYTKTNAFERVPYVLSGAVQAVIDQQSDPQIAQQMRSYDFHQVVDNSAVRRLVDAGFFRELFGESIRAEEERKATLAY